MIIQHADLLPEEEQPYVHTYLPFSKVKSYLSPQGTLVRQYTQFESYSFMEEKGLVILSIQEWVKAHKYALDNSHMAYLR